MARSGSIVAIIAGTKSETVIEILQQIPKKTRKKVTEITLDMARNMALIAKRCFPLDTQETDRSLRRSDSCTEIGFEGFTGDQNQTPLASPIEAENESIEQAKVTQTRSTLKW